MYPVLLWVMKCWVWCCAKKNRSIRLRFSRWCTGNVYHSNCFLSVQANPGWHVLLIYAWKARCNKRSHTGIPLLQLLTRSSIWLAAVKWAVLLGNSKYFLSHFKFETIQYCSNEIRSVFIRSSIHNTYCTAFGIVHGSLIKVCNTKPHSHPIVFKT